MIKAANVPGIQPAPVKISTNNNDPHPLSNTANGGQNKQINTRINPIVTPVKTLCTVY